MKIPQFFITAGENHSSVSSFVSSSKTGFFAVPDIVMMGVCPDAEVISAMRRAAREERL